MKRLGNLYQTICSVENLQLADQKACKKKSKQYGVMTHIKNRDTNILRLHEMLKQKQFKTSAYKTFLVYEPKEREVFRLPYFPDRIVHHAIMNVMEPVFVGMFTADTYSCIKGKGIHAAVRNLKKVLINDPTGTTYCLKLDIKKFYPSIDHDILKDQLRRKIKDQDLLWLMDEIIDSAPGVPIGNYLSQYFANFYLTGFDHWIKEVKMVRYYFRYADDIVILGATKEELHALLAEIKEYLWYGLKLRVKQNYQIFPVEKRGIDFVGYRFWHNHTWMRNSIKKRFARMLFRRKNKKSIAAYWGWAKHCDSRHLIKKLLNEKFQGPRNRERCSRRSQRGKNKSKESIGRNNRSSPVRNKRV